MRRIVMVVMALLVAGSAGAWGKGPEGRIAVSCGEGVAIVDPADGRIVEVPTGPVGWLYPAPGGVLYAPDTRRDRTTAIDLLSGGVRERLDGVMMPVFGVEDEQYVVAVGGRVLIATYPDRLVLRDWEVPLRRPWRVRVSHDGLTLYVLDRPAKGASLGKVDLLSGREEVRTAVEGEPDEMILLEEAGLVAVARPGAGLVELRSGTLLNVEGGARCDGRPTGLAFDGRAHLLVGVAGKNGGEVLRFRIRRTAKNGLSVREKGRLELPAAPGRMAASPDGRWLAVGGADGGLWITATGLGRIERSVKVPGPVRDVVWPDLERTGPLMPEWSNRGGGEWAKPGS